jgi:dienelactone hydrolase
LSLRLSARGPFHVGLRELDLPSSAASNRMLPTSIWYPTSGGTDHAEDAPHSYGQPHRATPDLPALDRSCPLILFSHGNSGTRHQSTYLTTHLASWGFVVAAPDHPGNTFVDSMTRTSPESIREAHLLARAHRPADASSILSALLGSEPRPDVPPLDATKLGVCGHSFGGWTAIKTAIHDPRVRALCCLAPASEAFVGRKAFEPDDLPLGPEVETLILAGSDDVLVDLETSIMPLRERLGVHARLEIAEGMDHFHFCDGTRLLHDQHEKNPRPNQPRPTRPMSELRGQNESHAWLAERITRFFDDTFGLELHRSA